MAEEAKSKGKARISAYGFTVIPSMMGRMDLAHYDDAELAYMKTQGLDCDDINQVLKSGSALSVEEHLYYRPKIVDLKSESTLEHLSVTKKKKKEASEHLVYDPNSEAFISGSAFTKHLTPLMLKSLRRAARADMKYIEQLRHDPNSADDKANTQSKASQSQATPLPPKNPFEEVLWSTMWAKLDANPTTQAYLQNNDFVRIMYELRNTYLKDKRVIQALGVLLNINFWTPTSADAEMPQSLSSLLLPERKRGMKAEPAEELDPMELKAEEGMDKDSQACKEWKLGNAAYAKNDFSTAIVHYTNVLELDSKNILCLMDRATTYLEMGQYEECIKDCNKAIKRGRQLKLKPMMIELALSTKGSALLKMEKLSKDYVSAFKTFQKALSEHHNSDTLKKLDDAENVKGKLEEQEFFDTKLANEEHEKGHHHDPGAAADLDQDQKDQKACQIRRALDFSDIELVKLLVNCDGLNLDEALALHYAVENCSREVVKALLKLDLADVNYQAGPAGKAPLHIAAEMISPDMLAILLDHHADPNVRTVDGVTPLDVLRTITSDFLLKGAVSGITHIEPNKLKLCLELVQSATHFLSREEGNNANAASYSPTSPPMSDDHHDPGAAADLDQDQKICRMRRALDSSDVELVKLMVRGEGLNLDEALALHYTVENCSREVVKALLELGLADVNYQAGPAGKAPLHIAAEMISPDMLAILLDHHADPNVRTIDGVTPLDVLRTLTSDFLLKGAVPGITHFERNKLRHCLELVQSATHFLSREEGNNANAASYSPTSPPMSDDHSSGSSKNKMGNLILGSRIKIEYHNLGATTSARMGLRMDGEDDSSHNSQRDHHHAMNRYGSQGTMYHHTQIEDIETELVASEQHKLFLMQAGGLGLTKPPKDEDWKNAKEIYLMDNELSALPENPRCPNLSALFLPRNYKLRMIPPLFFDCMPALQILNLSKTGIKSLPNSLNKLVSLKRLFLNDCHRLMMLSPKVADLEQLEVLDLEGAKIMDLPKEIKKLINLTCLEVSFYGYGRRAMQSNAVIPCGVISALSQLEELNVDVNPDDEQWDACVEDIVNEVCTLKRLETLKFYFPKVELLSHFHWNSLKLSHFRFNVGRHVKRIMSRVPRDVEFELERWERCLRYMNGVGVPRDIKNVLQHVTSFFLDRHVTVKKLSDFGTRNMKQLKCCVVGECNEVQVIIDAQDAYGEDGISEIVSESYDSERIVLGSLEYLYIYYMKSLRSIWEGSVPKNSLFLLKSLALRTCPQLTTIFTQGLLANLCNLEEIKVEDCPSIKSMVSCEISAERSSSYFLPNLKKISLHYMPGLISISSGLQIAPKLEWLSFYNCPNLKNPLIDEISSQDLKKIKGERSWWEALEWSSCCPSYLEEIFVPIDIQDC